MNKEFIVSVYLQGASGLHYPDDSYLYPALYTLANFPNVTLTDYRQTSNIVLEKLFDDENLVEEKEFKSAVGNYVEHFNQPAKLVIWESSDKLTLALYDTNEHPTKRFLIHTDLTNEIGIYDYHWEHFNWLNAEEFTYMAVYDIPS